MDVLHGDGVAREDALVEKLRNIAHWILTAVFGLLPLIFIPLPTTGLEHTKVLAVVFALAVALIFFSLAVLRSGTIAGSLPLPFLAFWVVVVIAGISAVFSGDLSDGLLGDTLGIHTTGFLLILALTMTVWMFVGIRKEAVVRLFMFFVGSTLALVLFHALRLILGPELLSLGIFGNAVATPIGGWNDLALFLGLTVLLALVTFEQLPLTKMSRIVFGVVVAAALVMLAVINFFFVWVVLGVVSLILVVYSLGKDRFGDKTLFAKRDRSVSSLAIPVAVCIISFLFVLGGSLFGGFINNLTGISYIEVRPSFGATIDVARGAYQENAFLGIGTNRFADAWRMYKDPSINQTIFWNTDFESGSGYIPTFFVTNGILGGIAWLVFLGLFLWSGIRTLLRSSEADRVWYFIATASFVGALFIWGMSFVYVPGAAMLLIGALCTGLMLVAGNELNPGRVKTISLAVNRRSGFILTLAVMAIIMGSVSVMYAAGRHYASVYTFLRSIEIAQPGTDLETIENLIAQADGLAPNDLYARRIAEYQIARINVLLGVAEPSEGERQQFQAAIGNGVAAARLATQRDATNPENWAVLGALYAILVSSLPEAEASQLYDLGKQALEEAKKLDPRNPLRSLALADLEIRRSNFDAARTYAQEAINMKSNYSDALFFLSQINIAAGDVPSAIASTEAMIALEPQNPSRYYQLGVLRSAQDDYTGAVSALERAIQLDQNFANARYFLAIAYSELNRPQDARQQLERILELNPGNALVTDLIAQLDANGRIEVPAAGQAAESQPVEEQDAVTQNNDDVTTTENPDTPLVTPLNTPADTSNASETESAPTQ